MIAEFLGTIPRVSAKTLTTAMATLLAAFEIHLYKSSFTPTLDSIHADFVAAEADFNTYAPATPVWLGTVQDVEGNWVNASAQVVFQPTDALAPNDIGGVWIETAANVLVAYFPFDAPVALHDVDHMLKVAIEIDNGMPYSAIVDE